MDASAAGERRKRGRHRAVSSAAAVILVVPRHTASKHSCGKAPSLTVHHDQVLLVRGADEPAPEGSEARDGVTPAMRDARRRLFRRPIDVSPDLVRRVEADILTIASVRALEAWAWIVGTACPAKGECLTLQLRRAPVAAGAVAHGNGASQQSWVSRSPGCSGLARGAPGQRAHRRQPRAAGAHQGRIVMLAALRSGLAAAASARGACQRPGRPGGMHVSSM